MCSFRRSCVCDPPKKNWPPCGRPDCWWVGAVATEWCTLCGLPNFKRRYIHPLKFKRRYIHPGYLICRPLVLPIWVLRFRPPKSGHGFWSESGHFFRVVVFDTFGKKVRRWPSLSLMRARAARARLRAARARGYSPRVCLDFNSQCRNVSWQLVRFWIVDPRAAIPKFSKSGQKSDPLFVPLFSRGVPLLEPFPIKNRTTFLTTPGTPYMGFCPGASKKWSRVLVQNRIISGVPRWSRIDARLWIGLGEGVEATEANEATEAYSRAYTYASEYA